ncbi:unnamed protein product [Urochloa humidicola]
MVSSFAGAAFADLFLAIAALELFSFLDSQTGAGTTASAQQAPLLDSAAEVEVWAWLPSAAAAGLLFIAAVASTYHHLSRRRAGACNRRRLSGLIVSALCVSVGTLEHLLFAQAAGAGGGVDRGGAQAQAARALGVAALRTLPAVATAAFYWGIMMLVFVAHIRAGGEGGGGAAAAGDGHGPVQAGRVRVLTEVAVGAAAALVCMMALALYGAK